MHERLDISIRKYAIQNALFYKGKANPKAVLGKVLSEDPLLKPKAGEILAQIEKIVAEVNEMHLEQQKEELEKTAPDLLEKKVKQKREGLPELKNAEKGKVVTRAAPNPNGPFHLGNARAYILSFAYADMYEGKFMVRFDDTDPKVKRPLPEAYGMIIEDLKWLGATIDSVHYASDRFEIYYDYLERLFRMGNAYVCVCEGESWKELTQKKMPCPCRGLPNDVQMKRYEKMFSDYKEGEAVVRIKTDIEHKDPAIRDWWAAKVVEQPDHPRTGNKYRVFPSYNLQSAIDDHELGTTHIFRGQEHAQNEERQKYLYTYFGWTFPTAMHHGRVFIEAGVLSTSTIKKGIEDGQYVGWDDIRLGTIRALKRRGYQPEALRKAIIDIGFNTNDVTISADTLSNYNRNCVEENANRFFFIPNPIKIKVDDAPKHIVELKVHPNHPERGKRTLDAHHTFYIAQEDHDLLNEEGLYRLMDCLNFRKKGGHFIFDSLEVDHYRGKGERMLHWLPDHERLVEADVMMNDATILKGLIEPGAECLKEGDIIQAERFGYMRLDRKEGKKLHFWYCHK